MLNGQFLSRFLEFLFSSLCCFLSLVYIYIYIVHVVPAGSSDTFHSHLEYIYIYIYIWLGGNINLENIISRFEREISGQHLNIMGTKM